MPRSPASDRPSPALVFALSVGLLVGGGGFTQSATSTAPPTVRFSFRPVTANGTVPAGYTPDNGAPYDPARGHGWVTETSARSAVPTPADASPNTRNRRSEAGVPASLEERRYTLIHLQCADICRLPHITQSVAWVYRVEPGRYTVTVGVGDANPNTLFSGPSLHTVNVEGVRLINRFSATAGNLFREVTTALPVTVSDGLLTVDGIGGTNTKINYIVVTRVN